MHFFSDIPTRIILTFMAVGDICTLLTKFFVEYLDIQGRKYYIQYNVSLINTYCHACEEGWGGANHPVQCNTFLITNIPVSKFSQQNLLKQTDLLQNPQISYQRSTTDLCV